MKTLTTLLCFMVTLSVFGQQNLTLPDESPYASVTRRVGITDITVEYHSPGVKGRQVWGSLVPYDRVWRAGANQNTIVTFTHNVSIDGKPLPAGTYGLHMIPGQNSWTVIFSKNHTSWGSFFYEEGEDALRTTVTPKTHAFTEWLTYTFNNDEATSTILSLAWENLEVPVKINVDVNEIVFQNIKNELRSLPGFTWEGWYSAASFCYTHKIHPEEAEQWLQTADQSNPGNFAILKLKADMTKQKGDSAGAEKIMKTAFESAGENDMNTYGYQLMGGGKVNEALDVFKTNAKRYPKSWNVHDSLAEALEKSGDKKEAIKSYETALKNNPPENQKKRIEETIKSLQKG